MKKLISIVLAMSMLLQMSAAVYADDAALPEYDNQAASEAQGSLSGTEKSAGSVISDDVDVTSAAVDGTLLKSGSCGANAKWEYYDNGLVHITGTGAMNDYVRDGDVNTTTAPWSKYDGDITSVVIDDGITSIGNYSFCGCSYVASITLPNTVTNIGDYAFESCRYLTKLCIPNSVKSIGVEAFCSCGSLKNVYIPSSVTRIGKWGFRYCGGLTAWCEVASAPDGWEELYCDTVYNASKAKYNYWSSLTGEETSVTIPSGYTEIPYGAFRGNTNLTKVTIPNSVTNIYGYAFAGCSGLKGITIPDSVNQIYGYAFAFCEGLTNITIPDSVMGLGYDAFYSCTGLTSITIPDGIPKIQNYTFYGCTNLKNVVIGDGVKEIGDYSFTGCSSLENITFGNSLERIGYESFLDCKSLKTITIPNSVTVIAYGAFRNCNLETVFIPKSVKTIGGTAFTSNDGCIINCEVTSKPSGWRENWSNPNKSTVVYGYENYNYEANKHKLAVVISPASYTYNGSNKRPAVKVKDGNGLALTNGVDYTVKYPSASKSVGKYTLTVTGIGNYAGLKATRTYTIKPKGTTISKLVKGKKAVTVRWKRQSSQTTGYQIRYSQKSSMASSKTVTVNKNKTTAKKISKLKAHKKYYVQVRTYKTVSGKKYYSAWSAKKSVVTK